MKSNVMVYYQITLYTNKEDDLDNLPLKGGVRVIKLLKYSGEDGGLKIGQEREDESLAMKILNKNLQLVESKLVGTNDPSQQNNIGKVTRYIKNEDDLKEIIGGEYQKVLVKKYESNIVRR